MSDAVSKLWISRNTMKAMERPAKSFLESILLNDAKKKHAPAKVQRVHCPTCGSSAERYHLTEGNTVRTQCSSCDYLMVACANTGRVIESYAPSFSPATLATSLSMGFVQAS